MRNFKEFGIETGTRHGGKIKTYCPQCRNTRRNKRDKSLYVDLDEGIFRCFHCDWKGVVPDDNDQWKEKKPYRPVPIVPVPQAAEVLSAGSNFANKEPHAGQAPQPFALPKGHKLLCEAGKEDADVAFWLEWLRTARGISAAVAQQMHLTTARVHIAQSGKTESCICFNYLYNGEVVNTKYRTADKAFKLNAGARLIPYNIDGIAHAEQCIIVEGEPDALACFTAGRTEVISVPGGANKNLTWLDPFMKSHFDNKKIIYLAVDNDPVGIELRNELLRRLGKERCRVVAFPDDCKDANDVLLKHGAQALCDAIDRAPQIPLEGVYTASDVSEDLRTLFLKGPTPGADTGLEELDKCITFETGRLCVITGIPGCGKSEFVDEMVLRLCLKHSWMPAFFSPENMPMSYHLRKLCEKLSGKYFKPGCMNDELYDRVLGYLDRNVCHIMPQDDFTVDNILQKAAELVNRRGIRVLVLDPFNRMEHQHPEGMSETQYISSFLDKLSNFALRYNCLVILVPHPRKMNRDANGRMPVPTLYDINGSAAFFNKCDFGLVIEREPDVVRVHVQKVKFRQLGTPGVVPFVYNTINGRYTPCVENLAAHQASLRLTNFTFDTNCWLPEEVQGELF